MHRQQPVLSLKAFARAGFKDIRDILTIRDQGYRCTRLPRRHYSSLYNLDIVAELRAFLAFVAHRMGSDTPIDDAWTAITPDEFDDIPDVTRVTCPRLTRPILADRPPTAHHCPKHA